MLAFTCASCGAREPAGAPAYRGSLERRCESCGPYTTRASDIIDGVKWQVRLAAAELFCNACGRTIHEDDLVFTQPGSASRRCERCGVEASTR
jgi:hypothetical protein